MSECIQFTTEPSRTFHGVHVPDFYFWDGQRKNWAGVIFDTTDDWYQTSLKVWKTRETRVGQWTISGKKRGEDFIIGWQADRSGKNRFLKLINITDSHKHLPIVVRDREDSSPLPDLSPKARSSGVSSDRTEEKTPAYNPDSNDTESFESGNAGIPETSETPTMPPPNGECRYGMSCRNKFSNPQHGVEYTHGGQRNISPRRVACRDGANCAHRSNAHHDFAYSHFN